MWVFPHSLSYFNELAGGPKEGSFHMVYSAFDWGQDVIYLKRWLETHSEAAPLKLCCYTHFDPRYARIDSHLPATLQVLRKSQHREKLLKPGWYAISATLRRGVPWFCPIEAYTYFNSIQPVASAGYSIDIYHITHEDVSRIMATIQRDNAEDVTTTHR